MNNMIKNISLATIGFLLILCGCNNENDFYEVGRQPVHLLYPKNDTVVILDYQKPDSLYRLSWESKRNFIDFNLIFSLSEDLTEKRIEVPTGIKRDFYMTTMQLDSVLSAMNIGIGQRSLIYWSVSVKDPDAGWCDEVRSMDITRCNLPTNVILLDQPASLSEIILDKTYPEDSITFNWNCKTAVTDYKLLMSFDENFGDSIEIECGKNISHLFSNEYLDQLLQEHGVSLGESATFFWKVKGSGNLNNPIESSAVREISIKRFARDPVQITLTTPANGSLYLLAAEDAEKVFQFKWECDTVGITYKVKIYDTELGIALVFDAGTNKVLNISELYFDQLLEQKFEMVSSQKKKLYWQVVPSDTLFAVSSNTGNFTIRRFEAVLAAQPITLVSAPANSSSYTLNYETKDATLTTMTWNCAATNVTYAIEYSLYANMSNSKTKALNNDKTYNFTHSLLDEMLSDVGASYLTRNLYWRITSTVNVLTQPSETRSMNLTGMLKPLVDSRDPLNKETYPVVRIGNNFWMAENLRATKYSDGAAFTTVDLPSKTYTAGAVSNPDVIGQYYTWPTALRNWNLANTNDNTIIQGVCPDGWHISTNAEWNALITTLSPSPATKVKSTQYWGNQSGVSNSSGLSLVPGGVFWHGNVGAPDNATSGGKSGYWTTTVGSATTAYMYEIFDWEYSNIVPWHYLSRPWSEGDGTASKMVNVRCVRTLNQ